MDEHGTTHYLEHSRNYLFARYRNWNNSAHGIFHVIISTSFCSAICLIFTLRIKSGVSARFKAWVDGNVRSEVTSVATPHTWNRQSRLYSLFFFLRRRFLSFHSVVAHLLSVALSSSFIDTWTRPTNLKCIMPSQRSPGSSSQVLVIGNESAVV